MQLNTIPSITPVRIRGATAGFIFLVIIAFLPVLYKEFSYTHTWQFYIQEGQKSSDVNSPVPFYRNGFIQIEGQTPIVHSPSVVELNDGNLLAVWYGGTREGVKDVAIYRSIWNRQTGEWTGDSILTGPSDTGEDLGRYIRKVGNPVLLKDVDGKIWLFYVSASVGAWSGSTVNVRTSIDNGLHWSEARRLVTSPFLNLSTLVRGAPFLYNDGSIGLPVYHEFLIKFGELLRLRTDGTIMDKVRISGDGTSLQPSVVPLDSKRGIAFLRCNSSSTSRVLSSFTDDGGRSWSEVGKLPLPNPDSSVMGIRTRDGSLLLAFNNSYKNRDNMSLARSVDDGQTWEVVHVFDDRGYVNDGNRKEFSYPFWIHTRDDMIHLVYTWNRKRIRHIYFNSSWLEGL